MNIRRATVDDIDQLHSLEQKVFSTPWSKDMFYQEIEDTSIKSYFVIETNEQEIIAYGGVWFIFDEGQITNIAVLPDYRGQGLGSILVKALLIHILEHTKIEEIFLEVRISNLPALQLYRKFGFTVKGLRKNYYIAPNEDAYIMSVLRKEVIL